MPVQKSYIGRRFLTKKLKQGFNFVARQTLPTRRYLDRKVRQPAVRAYKTSTGSTKALFIGGAVFGAIGWVGIGATELFDFAEKINISRDASYKLLLASKALDVAAVGKFFVIDTHKKKIDQGITNPLEVTRLCLKMSFDDAVTSGKRFLKNTSWATKAFAGAGVVSIGFNIAGYVSGGSVPLDEAFRSLMPLLATGISYYADRAKLQDDLYWKEVSKDADEGIAERKNGVSHLADSSIDDPPEFRA